MTTRDDDFEAYRTITDVETQLASDAIQTMLEYCRRHEELVNAVNQLLIDIRRRYEMNADEQFQCPYMERVNQAVKKVKRK